VHEARGGGLELRGGILGGESDDGDEDEDEDGYGDAGCGI
jgi:hypothetical protein